MLGARPSPRHRLAAAMPHLVTNPTPPQFLWKPKQLSMWGNADYGDCTVAEEAFAKGATFGVFVPDATVIAWARVNGAIDGDTLIDVLTKMQKGGFVVDGKMYDDGSPTSVDWENAPVLQNAIAQGPVKIGVAATQLQNAVPNPSVNGWLATGFTKDIDLDHCISLAGYGTISWLLSELGGTLPGGVDGTKPGYAVFTWNSLGVLDVASLVAICGEAWLRNPSTLIKS
jgi:hypothetical protein